MFILFEEDGAFKAGTILSDNQATLQIEHLAGKRAKIKAANVILRYAAPAAGELLPAANELAAEIDAAFLWECAGDGEFSFQELADDYYGHAANAVEATALLLAVQAAPLYFHRKGKGRFRKAPPEILAAALASAEKKRQQAIAIERMTASLQAGELPPEFLPRLDELIYSPDRNRPETKALEAACAELGVSAPQLLQRCGAIKSAHDYHYRRFCREYFPRGDGFADLPALPASAAELLPLAEVAAFSLDDASTTEIDDAFSLTELPGVGWRIGIHIAAPGLDLTPEAPLAELARSRLSTVYMPGKKLTMLPPPAVGRYTLAAGQSAPALSLYLTVTPEFEITHRESRLERLNVAANLRLHEVEPLFAADAASDTGSNIAFASELAILRTFAAACEARRGKPAATQGVHDYTFSIAGDLADAASCRVTISERQRGSPLDTLVSELMIVANATWGDLLASRGIAAIYRSQTAGKVRMTTAPQPHEGLGVAHYLWATSPLRRYVDLINQWQIIAALREETPRFGGRGTSSNNALFAALRDFELTYAAYGEFQRSMERYWCLRWLQQEAITEIGGSVRRENLVKIDHLPLLLRIASLPELLPGTRVRLAVGAIDELGLEVDLRFQGCDPLAAADDAAEAAGEGDAAEATASGEIAEPAAAV